MFIGAAISENEMGVRIDEAGENHAIAEVDLFGFSRESVAFNFLARSNRDDAPVFDEQCAITDDGRIGERFSATRRGASESQ